MEQAKKTVGRKKKPTVDVEVVKMLAGKGLTKEQVAGCCDLSYRTFMRQLEENPEIDLAFQSGRSQSIAVVANKLFEKAVAGDNACLIFYLKAIAGWRETSVTEIQGSGGGPVEMVDVRAKLFENLKKLEKGDLSNGSTQSNTDA